MSDGLKSVVYPVSDVAGAKATFGALLGVEPHTDEPYYVGYQVGGLEVGLDPNGHRDGAIAYYKTNDIAESLRLVLAAGATLLQDVTDVGGGVLIASAKDAQGNLVGLIQG